MLINETRKAHDDTFIVTTTRGDMFHFRHVLDPDREDPGRQPGRTFELVQARVDGAWVVTHGTCNHVRMIDQMIALNDPHAEQRAALRETIAEAQAKLQQAQNELAAL